MVTARTHKPQCQSICMSNAWNKQPQVVSSAVKGYSPLFVAQLMLSVDGQKFPKRLKARLLTNGAN